MYEVICEALDQEGNILKFEPVETYDSFEAAEDVRSRLQETRSPRWIRYRIVEVQQ